MGDGAPPSGHDGPHAFVGDAEHPVLDDDDRKHLGGALRLRNGDRCTVSDGQGRWRICEFGPELLPRGEITTVPRPRPAITIGFVVLKGGRPDLIVAKLTELGVDRIVPLHADHSVVRWAGERATRHVDRLRRVAREAAMQSRRVRLPAIGDVVQVRDLIAAAPNEVVLAHPGGRPPTLAPSRGPTTVLIGPEGGWSSGELDAAGGTTLVGLGPQVLRAETAAIAAGVVLCGLRSGVIGPRQAAGS